MITFLTESFPLWEVVRTLLFYVRLCIGTMSTVEFLRYRVLDFNRLNLLV